MAQDNQKKSFLQLHQQRMEHDFWAEMHSSLLYLAIESLHTNDVIKEWSVCDVVKTEHKILVKWCKRFRPLTDEELKEKYGR